MRAIALIAVSTLIAAIALARHVLIVRRLSISARHYRPLPLDEFFQSNLDRDHCQVTLTRSEFHGGSQYCPNENRCV
jgi:hypothetical protein